MYVSLAGLTRTQERFSDYPATSRIARGKAWRADGLFLLAQLRTDVLEKVLDMTLPQHAAQRRGPKPAIRLPADLPLSAADLDAVIYIQCIADRDGCGLTCAEFDDFLDAMEVGAGLRLDPTGRFSRQGSSLQTAIDRIYLNMVATRAAANTFYSTINANTFKDKVRDFVRENRHVLAAARAAGKDHILFKFETGWSGRGYDRLRRHRHLGSDSPDHFRLALLVLQHLHPTRGFKYHQFVLLDVLTDAQAGIGEALGTELCCSAKKHGGFNVATAGISVNTAENVLTPKQWRAYSSAMVEIGRLSNVESNILKVLDFWQRQTDKPKVRSIMERCAVLGS